MKCASAKKKGNTVRGGLVDMAACGGINAGLKVASRRKHIMSANDTLVLTMLSGWHEN